MEIARITGDADGMRKLALRQLFNHHFNMDHFLLVKKYTPTDHWPETLAHIIQQISSRTNYTNPNLFSIYYHEGLCDKLLDVLDNDDDSHFYHINEFKSEDFINFDRNRLITIYLKRIRTFCEHANNRKLYRVIANQLWNVTEIGGGSEAAAIAEELRQKYPRRKALLEELSGI